MHSDELHLETSHLRTEGQEEGDKQGVARPTEPQELLGPLEPSDAHMCQSPSLLLARAMMPSTDNGSAIGVPK